jgi:hypothetical protein
VDGFVSSAYEHALLSLMIEVDVEDGGPAMVPYRLGNREMKENHALDRFAGINHGFAEERFGGERFERGKGGENGSKVLFFDRAGDELFAIGGDESRSEVFEEEWEVEVVVDAEIGKDVEIVLGLVTTDNDGVGLEDGLYWKDDSVGDSEVRCLVRGSTEDECNEDAKNQERKQDWG